MTDPAAMRGALILTLLLAAPAAAQEPPEPAMPDFAVLTWQHPRQYTNETPLDLNDIEATEIEYGLCPLLTTTRTEVPAPTEYVVKIPLLTPGLWCFRARTRLYGLEWSEWSEVTTRDSPLPAHSSPTLPPFQLTVPT